MNSNLSENEVISFLHQHVSNLKQKPNGTFSGLCPFHTEKSSSFFVSIDKYVYKCFGCDKGGSLNTLLREIGGDKYIRYTYHKTYEIEKFEYTSDKDELRNNILLDILQYSKNNLNKESIAFLKKRGLSHQQIIKSELGFAAGNLVYFLLNKYSNEQLKQFDFFRSNSKGQLYFMLFNKIIFPIFDNERLVALAGRSIEQKAYINLPNDAYYAKYKCFYFSNYLKHSYPKNDELFIVEGYFDVISLFKKDKVAWSIMGSSLSDQHINKIKEAAKEKKIISCFDLDEAGMKVTLHLSKNVDVYRYCSFATKDIDEAILNNRKIKYLTREQFLKKYVKLITPTNLVYLYANEKVEIFKYLLNNTSRKNLEKFEYDQIMILCSLQLFYEKEILKLSKNIKLSEEILNSLLIYDRTFILKKAISKLDNKLIKFNNTDFNFNLISYHAKMIYSYQQKIRYLVLIENVEENVNEFISVKRWLANIVFNDKTND